MKPLTWVLLIVAGVMLLFPPFLLFTLFFAARIVGVLIIAWVVVLTFAWAGNSTAEAMVTTARRKLAERWNARRPDARPEGPSGDRQDPAEPGGQNE